MWTQPNLHTKQMCSQLNLQTTCEHKQITHIRFGHKNCSVKKQGCYTVLLFKPKLGCNTVLVLQPTVQVQTGRKRPKVIASNHRFPKSDAHALKWIYIRICYLFKRSQRVQIGLEGLFIICSSKLSRMHPKVSIWNYRFPKHLTIWHPQKNICHLKKTSATLKKTFAILKKISDTLKKTCATLNKSDILKTLGILKKNLAAGRWSRKCTNKLHCFTSVRNFIS